MLTICRQSFCEIWELHLQLKASNKCTHQTSFAPQDSKPSNSPLLSSVQPACTSFTCISLSRCSSLTSEWDYSKVQYHILQPFFYLLLQVTLLSETFGPQWTKYIFYFISSYISCIPFTFNIDVIDTSGLKFRFWLLITTASAYGNALLYTLWASQSQTVLYTSK